MPDTLTTHDPLHCGLCGTLAELPLMLMVPMGRRRCILVPCCADCDTDNPALTRAQQARARAWMWRRLRLTEGDER